MPGMPRVSSVANVSPITSGDEERGKRKKLTMPHPLLFQRTEEAFNRGERGSRTAPALSELYGFAFNHMGCHLHEPIGHLPGNPLQRMAPT